MTAENMRRFRVALAELREREDNDLVDWGDVV